MADVGQRPLNRFARSHAPGLTVVAAACLVSLGVNLLVPAVSPLMVALALGVVVANSGVDTRAMQGGLSFASRRLLRIGIVLLGLQVSFGLVLGLGSAMLAALTLVVVLGFLFTVAVGRLLRLSTSRTLLMACGFSICGASAVVAMDGVVKADDEDVTAAIAAVTVFGTVCIAGLPLLDAVLPLTAEQFALWAGLSVHEVAQVVATTAVAAPSALAVAVTVKLGRVLMLAPVVAGTAIVLRYRRGAAATRDGARLTVIPLFVVGFLVMVTVASAGVLPQPFLEAARVIQLVLMTAALFAMGTAVRLVPLIRSSGRLLVLGAVSTCFMVTAALAAVLITT